MLKVARWILGAAVGLIALGVVAIVLLDRFGSVETRYRCDGKTVREYGEPIQSIVFLELDIYRWIKFRSDSDGMVWTEVPNGGSNFYPKVICMGHLVAFATGDSVMSGGYSRLSNALWVNLNGGIFEGLCTRASDQ